MKTVRLTMAQALVRFLENQYIAYDDQEHPFVEGVIMLPGHGCVLGIGQALTQEANRLKVWQGKNEQGMAQTAVAFAKHAKRKKIIACTNLKPVVLRGVESNGMILSAAAGKKLSILTVDDPEFKVGAQVG